jgi:adenylate dimethylallyltransferase
VIEMRNGIPHVYAIIGPTGTGKTAHAVRTARKLGAPVVVADRIQCFIDLAITSGRSAGDDVSGVSRWFLGDRVVADGDYPARAACQTLCYLLGKLAVDNPLIVLEGGSISVLTELVACHDELPFELTFELLPIPNPEAYWQRLLARARHMLRPAEGGPGIVVELAAAWCLREQREFVSSIKGLEVIIDWCAENGVAPESLGDHELDTVAIDQLATAITGVHTAYARDQEKTFAELVNGIRT